MYETGARVSEVAAVKISDIDFRVSRITHLIDRGMPIQDVQILAGHTNINTTQGYYRNTISNIKYSYKRAAQ